MRQPLRARLWLLSAEMHCVAPWFYRRFVTSKSSKSRKTMLPGTSPTRLVCNITMLSASEECQPLILLVDACMQVLCVVSSCRSNCLNAMLFSRLDSRTCAWQYNRLCYLAMPVYWCFIPLPDKTGVVWDREKSAFGSFRIFTARGSDGSIVFSIVKTLLAR